MSDEGGTGRPGPPGRAAAEPPVRRLFRIGMARPDVDREIDDELDFHVRRTVEALVASGWERPDAEREASRRFGDLALYLLLSPPDHVERADRVARLPVERISPTDRQLALSTCNMYVCNILYVQGAEHDEEV